MSPQTHEVVAKVSEASEEDVDCAVAAAKAAQPAWAALTVEARSSCFKKLAALVREHNDELARLEAVSMGKPVSTYIDGHAFSFMFDYYSEAGYNIQGTSSLNTPGFVNLTFRQPYGVVAVIIPWNVPLLFFAKKVAPALAVGNTVVLKSSEKAPLASAANWPFYQGSRLSPRSYQYSVRTWQCLWVSSQSSHGRSSFVFHWIHSNWKTYPASIVKVESQTCLS